MKPTKQIAKFKELLIELGTVLMIMTKTKKVGMITIIFFISMSLSFAIVVNAQQREINEQKITIEEQKRLIQENSSSKIEQQSEQKEFIRSIGTFELTAYCPCSQCSSSWSRTTATGTKAAVGRTIGVNPNIIPYGSRVLINGHEYIAEDTGGAMQKNPYVIDIFMESHKEALKFGRQRTEVFILE